MDDEIQYDKFNLFLFYIIIFNIAVVIFTLTSITTRKYHPSNWL